MKVPSHWQNIILLFIGLGIWDFAFWQSNVLEAPRMTDFYTGIFEVFTGVRMSVGFAYNLFRVLMFVGLVIGVLSLWTWEDEKVVK